MAISRPFKEKLLAYALDLAFLAEAFHEIEMVFMAGSYEDRSPGELARLFNAYLENKDTEQYRCSKGLFPIQAYRIQYRIEYSYSSKSKALVCKRAQEEISQDTINARLKALNFFMQFARCNMDGEFINVYLKRQKEYYLLQSKESKQSKEPKREELQGTLPANAEKELLSNLEYLKALLCCSPQEAISFISNQYKSDLCLTEKEMEKLCQTLILHLFVGRDLKHINYKTQKTELFGYVRDLIKKLDYLFSHKMKSSQSVSISAAPEMPHGASKSASLTASGSSAMFAASVSASLPLQASAVVSESAPSSSGVGPRLVKSEPSS